MTFYQLYSQLFSGFTAGSIDHYMAFFLFLVLSGVFFRFLLAIFRP